MIRRFFRQKIRKGLPISSRGFADGIQGMAYALENMQVNNGHIEWTPFGAPVIYVDAGSAATQGRKIQKAWDLAFSESGGTWTATFTNCVSWRAGKTEVLGSGGTLTHTMGTGATTYYLAEKYNMATGESTIVEGTTISNTVQTGQPSDSEAFRYTLLYQVTKDTDSWKINIDYRTQTVRANYG
jgi:hypothetical protein